MYAQIFYYCPKCRYSKMARIGNRGLPAESLRFQIEVKGFICPSCGFHITGLTPKDYDIIEDQDLPDPD